MITRAFRVVDGRPLRADVDRPDAVGAVPAILWIHGGGLILGGRGDLVPWQRDRYLAEGWAVVAPDYRLAPETPIEAILGDIDAAWAWLATVAAAEHDLDATRMAIVGHSAGAYLTLARGASVRPRPRALVAFYGYGDVAGDWYTKPAPFYVSQPAVSRADAVAAIEAAPADVDGDLSPRASFYVHARQQGTWPREVLGVATDDPEALARYCPELHVTADHPPTLLIHGDADEDVPVERSVAMARALERAGVRHELLRVPDVGHGFDGDPADPRATAAIDRMIAFLHVAFRDGRATDR